MRLEFIALSMLEKIFNSYLRLDPESPRYLAPLQNKVIKILLPDWQLQSYWLFLADGVQILAEYNGAPDTFIKGSLRDLLRAAYPNQSDALSSAALEIEGDAETAQHLQTLLQRIEIDWEELLAQVTGDVIAHHAGNQVRRLVKWGRYAITHLQQNMTDYLQEELHYFPTREEVEDFFEEVNTLRHDTERLLARWRIYGKRE